MFPDLGRRCGDSFGQGGAAAPVVAARAGLGAVGRHPVGWLLLAMGLSLSVSGTLSSYRWYGIVARPGSLPAAAYLAGLTNGINIVFLACAGFIWLRPRP